MSHKLEVKIKKVTKGETHSLPIDTCGFCPTELPEDGFIVSSNYFGSSIIYLPNSALFDASALGEITIRSGEEYDKPTKSSSG